MKKRELLEKIREYGFYAVDLNLYLDNFPDNKEALKDYMYVSSKLRDLMEVYEDNYGPLVNFGISKDINHCKWTNEPWPWEREAN